MVDSEMNINNISRQWLYFDQYAYKIELNFKGRRVLKSLKLNKKDFSKLDIYDKEFYSLCLIADCLSELVHPNKQCFQPSGIIIYSNSLEDIQKLADRAQSLKISCPYITHICHVYDRDKNFVYLKNPQYNYRSFFNNVHLNEQQKNILREFFQNNSHSCSPSGTVRRILHYQHDWRKHWLYTTDFVDHNFNDQEILMLHLIVPDLFKTTKTIRTK
jgi:hypothetical protein